MRGLSCRRRIGLGIRRLRYRRGFLTFRGLFSSWWLRVIHNRLLRWDFSTSGLQCGAELPDFGFLGISNLVHAIGKFAPRFFEGPEFFVQRLKFIFASEGARRFDERIHHVI